MSTRRRTKARAAKGAGTVYQRCSDGRWCCSVWVDGSRVVRSAKTRAEAEQKRLELLQSRTDGRLVPGRVPTVGQWLDIRMDTVVRENRAQWTVRGYEVVIGRHIKPVLGKVKLDKLTPADVRTWQHKLSRTVNDRTGEVYSGKTIVNARRVLHAALRQAVRDGGLGLVRNSADASQGPRFEEKETSVFEPDEARRFATAVAGDRLEALYVLALALGVRQGSSSGSDGRT